MNVGILPKLPRCILQFQITEFEISAYNQSWDWWWIPNFYFPLFLHEHTFCVFHVILFQIKSNILSPPSNWGHQWYKSLSGAVRQLSQGHHPAGVLLTYSPLFPIWDVDRMAGVPAAILGYMTNYNKITWQKFPSHRWGHGGSRQLCTSVSVLLLWERN